MECDVNSAGKCEQGRVLAETVLYDRLRIINRQDPAVSPYVEILIDLLDNSTNVCDVLFFSQPTEPRVVHPS